MGFSLKLLFAAATVLGASTTHDTKNSKFNIKPFKIDLGAGIPRLHSLVNNTHLPEKALYPTAGVSKGIELETLRELSAEWVTGFDWAAQEVELNRLNHFTAEIEGLTVHFVHAKSKAEGAIPVLLLHGWPGSFHEFLPVIEPLTQPVFNATSGRNVSFDVVVPSLPGFVFSSAPPRENWTTDDTARIFNTLMTEALGYGAYAVHGTDWGSSPAYILYSAYSQTVRAAHFVFIPFFPPSAADIAARGIALSRAQKVTERRNEEWNTTGRGYFDEQTNKPNDIGLALYDSPVGQLAWIASKFKAYSDPRAGTPPSLLTNTAILTSVSLYYLTHTFLSSVWIYASNPQGFATVYTKAPTDAPLLFSLFEYNIAFWPEEYVEEVGNLVDYRVHDFGGHFAGLDNPPALIEDIRNVANYFRGN